MATSPHPIFHQRIHVLAAILLLCCAIFPAVCSATDDILQKRELYFSGFQREREKLISGIVRGVGERVYAYPDGEVIKGHNETLLVAFDYSKGLMRVDREIPRRAERSESRQLRDTLHTFFVRIPEYDVCAIRRTSGKLRFAHIVSVRRRGSRRGCTAISSSRARG